MFIETWVSEFSWVYNKGYLSGTQNTVLWEPPMGAVAGVNHGQ